MAVVKNLAGNVLEGWERTRTVNGVPYYINHKDEATQWDHPEMLRLLEELQQYNGIKYAAYRSAEKLKHLIATLRLNMIRWTLIEKALLQHGYRYVFVTESLNSFKLEAILFSLCELGQTDTACTGQTAVHAELLLNLILNMFDADRKEGVPLVFVTIVLGVLCTGRLLEKYKYICHHFIDKTNFLMKKHIQIILQTLAKIPEFLGEKLSFGGHLVIPALESCCQQNCGLSEEGFLEWLFREPQTLVWLPTYARLKASEHVSHPIRCAVCKVYPIIGLRYCCLHCLKYDSCQNCFFRGRISKGHKVSHPMCEYCHPITSWEETKTLLKALKNKLNRNGSRNKPGYLPIAASDHFEQNATVVDGINSAKSTPLNHRRETVPNFIRTPVLLSGEHQRELESIIVHLEDENRHLSKEIDKYHTPHSENGGSSGESHRSSQGSWEAAQGQRDFILARQELLEDHAHQMELQIKRLKQLLQCSSPGDIRHYPKPPNLPLPPIPTDPKSNSHTWLESTPVEGKSHIPPQQWMPFVKLQTELDNLERLTTGLQENSKLNISDIPHSNSTFTHNKMRRSCRGVSFTDQAPHVSNQMFQRHGSVRPKFHSPPVPQNAVCSYISSTPNSIYDNCGSSANPMQRSHLPNGRISFESHTSRHFESNDTAMSLPQLPPPKKTVSHLDAELQHIIDQLERVLPNSWSSAPTLLPEEKAKVMQAVSEVEEAMQQFLVCKTKRCSYE